MNLTITSQLDTTLIEPLVRASHPEWDWLHASAADLELEVLRAEPESPTTSFVVLQGDERPLACARVALLPWDSEILGIRCARLRLWVSPKARPDELAAWILKVRELALDLGAQLVDTKLDTRLARLAYTLHIGHFYVTDCLVSYDLHIPNGGAVTDATVREATESDAEAVADIAEAAFADSAASVNRFVVDPHLGSEPAARLYRAWAINCLAGSAADIVLVSQEGRDIGGFISCRIMHGPWDSQFLVADIPLNAVRRQYRGRGHYTRLVEAAVAWARARGCGRMHIRTQITAVAVHATWRRLGAGIAKTVYSFHSYRETAS